MLVEVSGTLADGVGAKDVILKIIREITVNGATNMVMEFRGKVIDAMSMEARMTLCNMAIEAGATCGICPPDRVTAEYLHPFMKDEFATVDELAESFKALHSDSDAVYPKTLKVDVSDLPPQVTWGYKPDEVKDITEMTGTMVDQVYIGSCTNGRIEDLRNAARILKGRKIADGVRGILAPATPKVYSQALEEGIIKIFMDAGFCVTNPTCGACLGMSNGVLAEGEVCASTTNRNFNGRMGKGGMVHLMNPMSAVAAAVNGTISDPREMI